MVNQRFAVDVGAHIVREAAVGNQFGIIDQRDGFVGEDPADSHQILIVRGNVVVPRSLRENYARLQSVKIA